MEDEPKGKSEQQKGKQGDAQAAAPSLPEKEEAGSGGASPSASNETARPQTPPKNKWERFKAWVWPMGFSDAVMLALTFAIAIGTLVSAGAIILQWREMVSGSTDTAAIRDAAQKQADAAQQFVDTAVDINVGIANAVDKLNSQAAAMDRLAGDTAEANSNVIKSDRPWLGASLSVADFESGKTPTYTVLFVNSGKRPTMVTLTQTFSGPFDFKDSPQYRPYDTTPSVSLIVPNQPLAASWKDNHPISEEEWKAINSDQIPFRIYAKAEYRDMRTNQHYWTHVCWRYTPAHTAINGGFSNCSEYNDAQ
jgi:hypothetical protein